MAPATNATLSLYPPIPSNMSTTTSRASTASATPTAFVTLSLGRSANANELLVPSAPSVHDPMDLKARCFDYLADLLLEHASPYSSAKLIAAFGHIPGSTYNATLEATAVCTHLRSAFFHVSNLVGLGFRDRDGAPITGTIDSNLDTRPAGIYYFAFRIPIMALSIFWTLSPASIPLSRTPPLYLSPQLPLALPLSILSLSLLPLMLSSTSVNSSFSSLSFAPTMSVPLTATMPPRFMPLFKQSNNLPCLTETPPLAIGSI